MLMLLLINKIRFLGLIFCLPYRQGQYKKGSTRKAVFTKGAGPICKCTGQCTLEGSEQGGEVDTGDAHIFQLVFKIDQSETTKSHI